MARTKQETINGWTVSAQRLPMLRGLALKAKIGKVLAPILETVSPLLKEAGGIENISIEQAAPLLAKAFAQLEPAQVPELVQEILNTTSVVLPDDKGRLNRVDLCDAGAIDRVFADVGELVLFKVVWFTLKVHFENFTGGNAFGQFIQATPNPSP